MADDLEELMQLLNESDGDYLDHIDNVPAELKRLRQWVCVKTDFKESVRTDIPVDAKSGRIVYENDESTWLSYEEAKRHMEEYRNIVSSLAFVLSRQSKIFTIEVSLHRSNVRYQMDYIGNITSKLGTYSEINSSGIGMTFVGIGNVDNQDWSRNDIRVVVKADRRYTIMTGRRLSAATISDCTNGLKEVSPISR